MQNSCTVATNSESHDPSLMFGAGQRMEKVQGHWALARVGKRVLRPGGIELTQGMLTALAIGPQDRVVEFAPTHDPRASSSVLLRCRARPCGR